MKKIIGIVCVFVMMGSLVFGNSYKLSTSLEKGTPDYQRINAVMTEIFKRAGNHTVELITMPAERALVDANAGKTDGDASRGKGMAKNYPNLIEIEAPLTVMYVGAYTLNPEIKTITLDTLKNYSIIYVRGTKVIESLSKFFNPEKVNITSNSESSINMLVGKRAEILLAVTTILDDDIVRLKAKNIIKLSPPLITVSVHPLLNKKNSDIASAVNKALQDMTKDGTLAKLMTE